MPPFSSAKTIFWGVVLGLLVSVAMAFLTQSSVIYYARIMVPGILLGLFIGKIVSTRPEYIRSLLPRYWLAAMRKMKRKHWVRLLTISLWVTAGSLVVANVIGTALQQANVPLYSPEEYPFTTLEQDYPWLVMIAVNVLPIFEEWVFRKIIIDETLRWRNSRMLAVLVSTVLFAVFHWSNPGTYFAFVIPLLGAGVLLSVCYLYTGMAGAVIAHNSYNTFLVIIGVLMR